MWLCFLWIGTLTLSLTLNCFQENWSLDSFYEVTFTEVALCLFRSNVRPTQNTVVIHFWASAANTHMVVKLQTRECGAVGPTFAVFHDL